MYTIIVVYTIKFYINISYKTARVVGLTPSLKSQGRGFRNPRKSTVCNYNTVCDYNTVVNSKSSSTAIHCLLILCWQNFVIQSVFAILICHIDHTINLRALIFSSVVVLILVQINNFEK